MKRLWVPQIIACGMLLWALKPDNPYGYYILLRWVCFGIFGFLAFQAFTRGLVGWVWLLGIIALVFNPIFRVSLTRKIWPLVDVVAAAIAVVSIFCIPYKIDSKPKGEKDK